MSIQWEALTNAKEASGRQAVKGQHFAKEARAFIDQIKALSEAELQRLLIEALKAADDFWAENKYQRLNGTKTDQGRLGTRVRLIDNSIQAVWYKSRFVGRGSKKQPFSSHISKGRTATRYPPSTFAKGTEWERRIGPQIEDQYERLRRRSAALSKLRAAVVAYERLLAESFAEYPEFSEGAARQRARGR